MSAAMKTIQKKTSLKHNALGANARIYGALPGEQRAASEGAAGSSGLLCIHITA